MLKAFAQNNCVCTLLRIPPVSESPWGSHLGIHLMVVLCLWGCRRIGEVFHLDMKICMLALWFKFLSVYKRFDALRCSLCVFVCFCAFCCSEAEIFVFAANQTQKPRMMKYQQDPPDSYKASYSCEFHACTKLHEMCTKLRIARRMNSCVFGSITSRVHEIARQYCDM